MRIIFGTTFKKNKENIKLTHHIFIQKPLSAYIISIHFAINISNIILKNPIDRMPFAIFPSCAFLHIFMRCFPKEFAILMLNHPLVSIIRLKNAERLYTEIVYPHSSGRTSIVRCPMKVSLIRVNFKYFSIN